MPALRRAHLHASEESKDGQKGYMPCLREGRAVMTSMIILAIAIGTIGSILLAVLVYLLAIGAQSDGVDRTPRAFTIKDGE